MQITHKIKMDLSQPGFSPKISVVQSDAFTRKLAISLLENGRPWKVPLGASVIIRYRKPNGESGAYDTLPDGNRAVSVSGNCVSILVAPEALSQTGTVSLMATIFYGPRQLSTFTVDLAVQALCAADETADGTAWVSAFLPAPLEAGVDQLVAVETVDEHGRVVSLKAVDMPTCDQELIRNTVTECLEAHDFSDEITAASITHAWNGTVLTVVSASGTSSADLKGEKGDKGDSPVKGEDYFTDEDKAEMVSDVLGSEQVAQMAQDIADIKADLAYEPIDITAFSNSAAGTYELGASIAQAKLSWSLNKAPANQRLNIAALEADDRAYTVPGPMTGNKTFTLTVTDERGATDSASTSITFLNGVYSGALDVSATYEDFSDMILHLTRKLQSSKALTFTANAGVKERLVYAIPSRYGTPAFTVGGFEGGFRKLTTEEFTNASGYSENYDLWVSDNLGLGSTTVVVQ